MSVLTKVPFNFEVHRREHEQEGISGIYYNYENRGQYLHVYTDGADDSEIFNVYSTQLQGLLFYAHPEKGYLYINNTVDLNSQGGPMYINTEDGSFTLDSGGGTLTLTQDFNAATDIFINAAYGIYLTGTHDGIYLDPAVGKPIDLQGFISFGNATSPSQITSDQNDYNPTNLSEANVLRLSTDASRNITGMVSASSGLGRVLIVHNIGANNIVLKDESGSSSAANRFALPSDVTLLPDSVALLNYDHATNRWRCVGTTGTMTTAPPLDADYLVGTSNGTLSGEIVVGTSPGGELGGTWASPTVDTTHSGSAHPVVSANTSVPAGNTVANTVSETNFASSYAVAANTLTAGKRIRLTCNGVYSTDAITAGNITFKVKFGSTTLVATGAVTNVVALTSQGWRLEADIVCFTPGGTGTVDVQGFGALATALNTAAVAEMQNTATVTVDTTAANTLQVSVTWSVASASNTIQLRQFLVEVLGG